MCGPAPEHARAELRHVDIREDVAAAVREGVTGWVRNLPDGRVEALLEGDSEAVTRVERAIRQGPRGARVETVEEERVRSILHEIAANLTNRPDERPGHRHGGVIKSYYQYLDDEIGGGEPASLLQLLGSEVHPDDPSGLSNEVRGGERIHA